MKFMQLILHINADEADTIITFIDELKTALTAHYGDEIKAQRTDHMLTYEEKNNDAF